MGVRIRLDRGIVGVTMLCLSGHACAPLKKHAPSSGLSVAQARSFIFDAAEASRFLWALNQCSELPIDSIAGTWTATPADTRLLDSKLLSTLQVSLRSRVTLRAEDYFFQYFGVLRHGKRIILINGFHDAVRRAGLNQPDNWTQEPVILCDAGMGAFQTTYEPDSGRLSELRFFSTFNGA